MAVHPEGERPSSGVDRIGALLEGAQVTRRRFDLGGMSTSVLEAGAGPPVVLLHGIGSFSAEWIEVFPALAETNRVVAPDMPGIGASLPAGRKLDADLISDWLARVIDRTCAQPPTIVGHSMGGSIAARFTYDHRDHVRGAILVDSSSLGSFRPSPGILAAVLRYGARPTPENRDRFLRHALTNPEAARARWGSRWRALEAYDLEQASTKSVSKANGQLLGQIGIRRLPKEILGAIERPVTLIWGTEDRLMRFAIAERAAARYGWPLRPIDGCGHGPHIERPDELATTILDSMASSG